MLAAGHGTTVERILLAREDHDEHAEGHDEHIEVAPTDLVLVTNGSMTDASTRGSHTTPPPRPPRCSDAWLLWHRVSRGRDDFGDPGVFDKSVGESQWESFTVTAEDPAFLDALERFSGRATGKGGLMTFTASNWLLTIVANHQPVYRDQPEGVTVWWGYALFPDKPGNHVDKPMTECSGAEILEEVLHHLPFDEDAKERVRATSTVVPCLMPYITSQFLVRRHGDRPRVVPKGSVNLAFIGQFAEVPDDVVFTVEYSVRTAWTAVADLLGLDRRHPRSTRATTIPMYWRRPWRPHGADSRPGAVPAGPSRCGEPTGRGRRGRSPAVLDRWTLVPATVAAQHGTYTDVPPQGWTL